MLWLIKFCVLSITLIALGACGTRGPLFLAPQQIKATATPAQQATSTSSLPSQLHPNTTKDQD
ncbi:MAG: lipoprotein [Betaproteobacteria bacterium]